MMLPMSVLLLLRLIMRRRRKTKERNKARKASNFRADIQRIIQRNIYWPLLSRNIHAVGRLVHLKASASVI